MRPITLVQTAPVHRPLGIFDGPEVRVGRRPTCEVCLSMQGISGVHAVLSFAEDTWYVLDPGADAPVRLNAEIIPYAVRVELPPGARLQLDVVEIEVSY